MSITNPMKLKLTEENAERITEEAERNGTPFAKIINRRLDESYSSITADHLISLLKVGHTFRMREMNTTETVEAIIALITRRNLVRIIFGARSCAMNGKCLVLAIEMTDLTVVVDLAMNSLARAPRIYEIERLIQTLYKHKLEEKSVICGGVDDTSGMQPDEALNHLYERGTMPFSKEDFVALMGKPKSFVNSVDFNPS